MAGFTFTDYRGKMKNVITFGEIMLRLSPPNRRKLGQARTFDALYGGGEANVVVSLVNYGMETESVTRLPTNDLSESCLQYLRQSCRTLERYLLDQFTILWISLTELEVVVVSWEV
jgi:sugar/nucleoside kinase (ribokinase family)